MSKAPVLQKKLVDGQFTETGLNELAQVIDTQYDVVISEALRANDLQRVTDIQWGRLFLTQKYGF